MEYLFVAVRDLAWPLAIAVAWTAGEFGRGWLRLPRISAYGLVGFALAHTQSGFLSLSGGEATLFLANVAFGLILFEIGYRINLKWLVANPWIGAASVLETTCTFAAVYLATRWLGAPFLTSVLLAALAMSTCPAAVLRIVNEERCSGQATERMLHLSVFSCVIAIFTFRMFVGIWTFQHSGSLWLAISGSVFLLLVSAGLGTMFGVAIPALLRRMGDPGRDATVAFAVAVILLVGISHTLKFSPVLATLTFGLIVRHRRIAFSQTQRNFGALGDLLTVLLFVFVASTLDWHQVATGIVLALAMIVARLFAKVAGVAIFSRISGISWRKGALTGLGMAPISVFAVLLLEQARYQGIEIGDQLAPLAAATLLLKIVGPVLTQRALVWARETREGGEA